MFIKLHADDTTLAVSTEKITVIHPIKLSDGEGTQICFGDDFVNVNEPFDEVLALVTSSKKKKVEKGD